MIIHQIQDPMTSLAGEGVWLGPRRLLQVQIQLYL